MLKMQVIGHLGKDADVNQVNGKTVINFNIAHSEKFRDAQGNQKDKTTWVSAAWWTDKTGIAPYLKKGTQVYADGQPEVRMYPKNDGTTGVNLILRVFSVQLLASPAGQTQTHQEPSRTVQPQQQAPSAYFPDHIDDLPF
jgi:single-strand DNA-binding protein